MKQYKIIASVAIALLSVTLFSCATTAERRIDSMYVMVYDRNNGEVMNVSIYVDDDEVGKTDIYGRLQFECYREKEAVVRAVKDGYETVESQTLLKPGSVLYIKMGSGQYYAQQAEKLLDAKDTEGARKMIDKALTIEDRSDWRYLQDVILRTVQK